MIGLVFRAASMLGPPNIKGIDAKDVQKKPGSGPVVAWILMGFIALIVGLSMANGGQVVSVITPLAIVMGLVVLGGTFIAGCLSAKSTSARLDQIPDKPTAQETTAELREAVEQRSSVAVLDRPVKTAPAPAPARTRLASRAEVLSEADLDARMVRMAQILIADCPACTARSAVFCTFQPGQQVTVLDRERGIIVHDARIGNALKTHTAKLEDVNAQFEGNIPDSVWRHAL